MPMNTFRAWAEDCNVFTPEGELRNPAELPGSTEHKTCCARKYKADHVLISLTGVSLTVSVQTFSVMCHNGHLPLKPALVWIWSHLGNTALGASVRAFPNRTDKGRKTHPNVGSHLLSRGFGLDLKEKWNQVASGSCNVTTCHDSLSMPALPWRSVSFLNSELKRNPEFPLTDNLS